MESKDETTNRVINFYSPLYLASIIVKEGVNQNEEVIKKYGELERSYDFKLNKSVNCSFSELQQRQDDCISDASFVSYMSMIDANILYDKGSEYSSKSVSSSMMQ